MEIEVYTLVELRISHPSAMYSRDAQVLAKKAMESIECTSSWEERRTILRTTCQDILSLSGATADEKVLASLGDRFGEKIVFDSIIDARSPSQAMRSVLSAIAAQDRGPLSTVIARSTVQALGSFGKLESMGDLFNCIKNGAFNERAQARWLYKNDVLNKAFDAIDHHRGATAREKAISRFARDLGTDNHLSRDLVKTRASALDAIAHATPGPLGGVLASIVLTSEKSSDSFGSVAILHQGFASLEQHPDLPEEVKIVAREALKADTGEMIPDPIEERRLLVPFMEKIPVAAETAARREEEEAARQKKRQVDELRESLNPVPALDVVVEDDVMTIDGFSMKRKRSV